MSSLPVLVLNSGSSSIKFSVYEAGNSERTKLHEGAVDGIGTDLGKFWIKDASGTKLVYQPPTLPPPAAFHSLNVAPSASRHNSFAGLFCSAAACAPQHAL